MVFLITIWIGVFLLSSNFVSGNFSLSFNKIFGLIIALLFCYLLLSTSNEKKINYLLSFISIMSIAYIVELILTIENWIPHESKTKLEILNELKKNNKDVFPNYFPRSSVLTEGFKTPSDHIFPLGTISNSITVFDNENGFYPIFETDEYGFNNIKNLYGNDHIDIVIIGDSFAEGVAVNQSETVQSKLNDRGFKTISLGKSSNGPLIQLASLKEYAEFLKPEIVFWFYFRNDLNDLEAELKSNILNSYLADNNFSQNLISKQEIIDSVLTLHITKEWNEMSREMSNSINWFSLRISNTIFLTQLRSRFNVINNLIDDFDLNDNPEFQSYSNSNYENILSSAKNTVAKWGGKLFFVYLPSYEEVRSRKKHSKKKFIIDLLNKLDIQLIDFYDQGLSKMLDPLSCFPHPKGFHYNAKGYLELAKILESNIISYSPSINSK